MKHLFIVRHGETDFNRRGIVQGKGVNSSINETGRKQAEQFYAAYKSEQFEHIYISSLKRTYQSIEPFVAEEIPIATHPGLDEISWGIHEGQESGDSFKDFNRLIRAWRDGDLEAKIDGGESPLEVQQRQQIFLDDLWRTNHQKVLLCSHGRSMRILLCTLLKEPLSEMDRFPHHNLCLYQLQWDGTHAEIIRFNDLSHLEKKV